MEQTPTLTAEEQPIRDDIQALLKIEDSQEIERLVDTRIPEFRHWQTDATVERVPEVIAAVDALAPADQFLALRFVNRCIPDKAVFTEIVRGEINRLQASTPERDISDAWFFQWTHGMKKYVF